MKHRLVGFLLNQLEKERQRIVQGWKKGLKRKGAVERILASLIVYGVGILITFNLGWMMGGSFILFGGLAIAHGTVLLRDDVILGILIAAIIGLVLTPIREGAITMFGEQNWIGVLVMLFLGAYVWVKQREAKTGKEFSISDLFGQSGKTSRKRQKKNAGTKKRRTNR